MWKRCARLSHNIEHFYNEKCDLDIDKEAQDEKKNMRKCSFLKPNLQ